MADSKHHISRSLESAKVWIDQAEESFDKDSDVRGELNLLLAQAELQRVREVNRSRQWRWKYPLLRHTMAFALAIMAAVGGFYWWDGQRQAPPAASIPSRPSGTVSEAAALAAQPAGQAAAVTPIAVQASPVPVPAMDTSRAEHTKPLPAGQASQAEKDRAKPDSEVRLAPDEMQQLIRAAGRSLRGQ